MKKIIVGQSGGPTAVINSSVAGGLIGEANSMLLVDTKCTSYTRYWDYQVKISDSYSDVEISGNTTSSSVVGGLIGTTSGEYKHVKDSWGGSFHYNAQDYYAYMNISNTYAKGKIGCLKNNY